jgi:sugar O-acyltransferase (sialic acid O-acetyltransferase NeuD family)
MTHRPVIVVGAGGHGVVLAEALLGAGREVRGFVDRDPGLRGATLIGLPVLGDDDALQQFDRAAVELANGIGGTGARRHAGATRRQVQQALRDQGWEFTSVRHVQAIVSPLAELVTGSQVLAGAVVQARARVEEGAIINTRAVVEHDVVVGAFAHVAPGAVLCGNVQVGAEAHVGAGAVVIQGCRVGERVVVGAGAAVTRDVEHGRVAGVPARPLRTEE